MSTIRRVAKNTLTPIITVGLNKLIDFGFTLYMVRMLGPFDLGKLAVATAFWWYFSIFTDFGLGTLLTREVAKQRSAANQYLSHTIMIRVALSLFSFIPFLAIMATYGFAFKIGSDTMLAAGFFILGLIPYHLGTTYGSLFNALEKMEFPAIANSAATLVRTFAGVMVLLLGGGIVGLAIFMSAAHFVTYLLLSRVALAMGYRFRFHFDPAFARNMLLTSFPLMLNAVLGIIYLRTDVLILKPFWGEAAVGFYSSAIRLVDGLRLFPLFFSFAIFPILSRQAMQRHKMEKGYLFGLRAMALLLFPIAAGGSILARPLVLLLFGKAYLPAAAALSILIWAFPIASLNSILQFVLIALNQQTRITSGFLLATIANLLGNLVLIPFLGLLAPSMMAVLTEALLLAFFYYMFRKNQLPLNIIKICAKPLIASAGMVLIVWLASNQNVFALILLGSVVYLVLLLLLGAFSAEDFTLIRQLTAKATPPPLDKIASLD